MGCIKVEGMGAADRILSSSRCSDGYRILDGGIYHDVPADGLEAYLEAWAKSMEEAAVARLAASCGEAMDLHETLGDFRLWRVAAPLDALRKVPGGWEATEAIVIEEITGRETIAQ